MAEALLTLALLLLWVALSYIVFQHAKDNGYSPCLWALVVFLFGVFGLIAYGIRNIV